MGPQLHFTITSRQHPNKAAVTVVSNESVNEYYVDTVKIATTSEGYLLILPQGKAVLQHGDIVITKEHQITINIEQPSDITIGYNSSRAPVRTLSDQWLQAGLDTFIDSPAVPESVIIPLNNQLTPADPLDFLMNPGSAQSSSNMRLPDIQPQEQRSVNWMPETTHYFDLPTAQNENRLGTGHAIQTIQPTHPFEKGNSIGPLGGFEVQEKNNAAVGAPIDNIDQIYQESQMAFVQPQQKSTSAVRNETAPQKSRAGEFVKKLINITQL